MNGTEKRKLALTHLSGEQHMKTDETRDMLFRNTCLLVVACLLLCSCGKSGPEKGNQQKSTDAKARRVVPLPTYYGFFAVTDEGLLEVKDGQEVPANAEFIWYDKAVAMIPSSEISFGWSGYYVRYEIGLDGDMLDAKPVKTWRGTRTISASGLGLLIDEMEGGGQRRIGVRVGPVEGKNEMIRITPTDNLPPGKYTFAPLRTFFVNSQEAIRKAFDAWPARMKFATLDELIKELDNPGEPLHALTDSLGQAQLHAAHFYEEAQEFLYKRAIASAEVTLSQKDFDAAMFFANKALRIRPDDKSARQIIDTSNKFFAPVKTLSPCLSYIWSVAFSPDGRYVAAANGQEPVAIWDTESGKVVKRLKLGLGDFEAMGVFFDPAGRYLAATRSGYPGAIIRLWVAGTWTEDRTFEGYSHAFTPDRRYLASVQERATFNVNDSRITIRAVGTWNTVAEFSAKAGESGLAFSPDGRYLASLNKFASTITLWETSTWKEARKINVSKWLDWLGFSSDGKYLSWGSSEQHESQVLDTQTWSAKASCGDCSLAFSAGAQYLVAYRCSALEPGTVRVLESGTWKKVKTLRVNEQSVGSVDFSPDGRWLATGRSDGQVKIWTVDEKVSTPPKVSMKEYEARQPTVDESSKQTGYVQEPSRVQPVAPTPALVPPSTSPPVQTAVPTETINERYSGQWKYKLVGSGANWEGSFTLAVKGTSVTGTIETFDSSKGALKGTLNGDTLELSRDTGLGTIQHYRFRGTGNVLKGTYWNEGSYGDSGTIEISR